MHSYRLVAFASYADHSHPGRSILQAANLPPEGIEIGPERGWSKHVRELLGGGRMSGQTRRVELASP
jgi:hypothetical protein